MKIIVVSRRSLLQDLLSQARDAGAFRPLPRVAIETCASVSEYSANGSGEVFTIYDDCTPFTCKDTDIVIGGHVKAHLSKPLKLVQLISLISKTVVSKTYEIQDVIFEPLKMRVSHSGRFIELTQKESELILYLIGSESSQMTKQQVLGEIWGYSDEVSTCTLETHISRLKQKLRSNSFPEFIAYNNQMIEIKA
ncbi:winged helix family transcriptional regulator [Rickettsiales endosymbiont of Peranema trichophorum]|uniref:winged helix-turn-helix domain-containing protein n=1 Tax=Rickettsiales endosymbiont of Peranema trichophorum TaxID=2486577 RepID=UPI001022DF10|nr:winged helix-turn-helix domain-containing protein [Rickettsiales endosymbiont of Peranema trichophorum]RZI45242.1 winged helix family transcriptional regulator [Rickettsiales endosymbiont of Peranema trichophorum]